MIPLPVEERLADALRLTGSVAIACRDAGLAPRALEGLVADDEALRARLEHARGDGIAALVEMLREIALAGGTPEPVLRLGQPVFGWWDGAAGAWIDPGAWLGGEDALRRAAAGGAVERKAVTRLTPRRFHLLLAYLRQVTAEAGAPEAGAPGSGDEERESGVDAPPIAESVEEWLAMVRADE